MAHWCVCLRMYAFLLTFDQGRFEMPEDQALMMVENQPDVNDALTRCLCYDVTKHAITMLEEFLRGEELSKLKKSTLE